MDEKRDKKGRFKKGYSGGPGRGNRNLKPLTYEDIELLLQSDLRDSDPKVRHTATRLLIAIKNKMPDPNNEAKINEELLAAQGKPVDINGYYIPDPALTEKQMRPSPTFNAIIEGV